MPKLHTSQYLPAVQAAKDAHFLDVQVKLIINASTVAKAKVYVRTYEQHQVMLTRGA
jgi:hypothetical protein